MGIPFILTSLLVTTYAFAQLKTFEPTQKIKATDFNHNFSYIESLFQAKNFSLSFSHYTPHEVIDREKISEDFDRVRSLGLTVAPLTSAVIKAEELNQSFRDLEAGALLYDDVPLSYSSSFLIQEDEVLSSVLSFENKVGVTNIQLVQAPQFGILNLNSSTGAFTYTPNSNYYGSDSFSFKVSDGIQSSLVSVVSLNISPVNDVPVVASQNLSLSEDNSLVVVLAASDADGDTLSYSYTQPSHGVLSGTPPNLTYTPHANFFGADSFTYKVNDGTTESETALISLNTEPVNDAPVITGTDFSVAQNSSAYSGSISLSDIDSPSFTYAVVTSPVKGTLVLNSNGSFSYAPALNSWGLDSFKIKANDGQADSNILTINVSITGSGIIVAGNTRTYFDGTKANSCFQYKKQSVGDYTYTGPSLGTGYYDIILENGATQTVYCDMTTDGGGWTLVMRQVSGGAVLASTSDINLASLHTRSVNAKMRDSAIRNLAAVGMKEAQIVYNNTSKYIFRYSASAWNSYSTLGWTNMIHDSKNTAGNWITNACNGHKNNSSFSTWSDSANNRCPTYYQGGTFYYAPYHYDSYSNISHPAPIDVYVR